MSPMIAELEKSLAGLAAEHKTLLAAVQAHLDAMRAFDTPKITVAADAIEASRTRIVFAETKRRQLMLQVVRTHQFAADITLAQIAEAVPFHRQSLLKQRDALRQVMQDVSSRTGVSSRVAQAMLGHLNTVVRMIAGAMQTAAVYSRTGTAVAAGRVGMIEAVG